MNRHLYFLSLSHTYNTQTHTQRIYTIFLSHTYTTYTHSLTHIYSMLTCTHLHMYKTYTPPHRHNTTHTHTDALSYKHILLNTAHTHTHTRFLLYSHSLFFSPLSITRSLFLFLSALSLCLAITTYYLSLSLNHSLFLSFISPFLFPSFICLSSTQSPSVSHTSSVFLLPLWVQNTNMVSKWESKVLVLLLQAWTTASGDPPTNCHHCTLMNNGICRTINRKKKNFIRSYVLIRPQINILDIIMENYCGNANKFRGN